MVIAFKTTKWVKTLKKGILPLGSEKPPGVGKGAFLANQLTMPTLSGNRIRLTRNR
ncbi:hypothetical protein V3595_10740 [Bacillus sp. CFBP9009]